MKNIYIILTKSDTVISNIIHKVTSDSYTHSAIGLDDDFSIVYSSSRKDGINLLPAGPCKENLRYGTYQRNPSIPCAVYQLEVSDDTYLQVIEEIRRFLHGSEYNYNFIGLFLCKLKIPYRRRKHVYCAEFVSEVLERSHAIELPKQPSLMKPVDFMKLPELKRIFSGSLDELLASISVKESAS